MGVNTGFADFRPAFPCWRYEPWDEAQHERVRRAAWLAWKDSEAKMPLVGAILEVIDRKGVLLVNWVSTFCRARWAHHFQWAWEQCGEDQTWHYVCGEVIEHCPGDHIEGRNLPAFKSRSGDHLKAYWDYMGSPQWFELRTQVLVQSRRICAHCTAPNATQVHHKTYDRLGCERLDDLEALCLPCHETEHHGHRSG